MMENPNWVISHHIYGVYVGRCKHESYWTLRDTAGQPAVTTFSSRAAAQKHVLTWAAAPKLQSEATYVPVMSGGPFDLAAVGLPVGDLFENLIAKMKIDPNMYRHAGGPQYLNG